MRQKIKTTAVRTYADEIIGYVWMVFFICTVLLAALLTGHLISPEFQAIVWLTMYGMPTFLSGVIIRYRGLMAGGICCWLLAVSTAFVPAHYYMLLLAAAVICGWILPGYG